jgi:hypothetical protein
MNDDDPTPEEMDAVTALLRDPALWTGPSADVEDRVLAAIAAEMSAVDPTGAASDQPIDDPAALDEMPLRGTEPTGPGTQPPVGGADPAPTGLAPAGGTTGASHRAPTGQAPPASGDGAPGGNVVDLSARRSRRRLVLSLAAAAAVAVLALAAVSLLPLSGSPDELDTVALAGGDNAPGASAVAEIEHLANGDRIVLKIEDLPPAPEGTFYAAWVIDDDPALRVGAGTFHMQGASDGEIVLWSGVSTEVYRTVSVTLQSIDDPAGPGQPILKGTLGSEG